MAYQRRTRRLRRAIEIGEVHSDRFRPPGAKRRKKEKPTPDAMKEANRRRREDGVRQRLEHYFDKNDLFATTTYREDERPTDMAAAKEDRKAVYQYLKKAYRKRGEELRWICTIERGSRGAWHMHWVINSIPDAHVLLEEAWNELGRHRGKVDARLIKGGGISRLAAYLTKAPHTEKRLSESDVSWSRNMPLPDPVVEEITKAGTWEDIRIPKGWYLDRDSYYEGINRFTGWPYRHYILLPLEDEMYKSHIYLTLENNNIRKTERAYGYVLSVEGRQATREGFGTAEGTMHAATLIGLTDALRRFTANSEIIIHAEDEWALKMLEKRLPHWAATEYRGKDGKQISCAAEWSDLWALTKQHKILIKPGQHEYTEWIRREILLRRKEEAKKAAALKKT